jgi:hypothetical protein
MRPKSFTVVIRGAVPATAVEHHQAGAESTTARYLYAH